MLHLTEPLAPLASASQAGWAAFSKYSKPPGPDPLRQRAPHARPPPDLHAQASPAFAHYGPGPGPSPAIDVGGPQYTEVGPAAPEAPAAHYGPGPSPAIDVGGPLYTEVGPAAPEATAGYDLPGAYPSSVQVGSTTYWRSPAFSATVGYEQPDDVVAAAALQAAGGGYLDLEGALAQYAQSGGGAAAGGLVHYDLMPAPRLAESSI